MRYGPDVCTDSHDIYIEKSIQDWQQEKTFWRDRLSSERARIRRPIISFLTKYCMLALGEHTPRVILFNSSLPPQPFDLDYFQVLFTLCDILAEVYSKILSFVGPSSSSSSSNFPGFPQPPSSTATHGTAHIFQSIYPATVSASGVSVNAIPSADRRQGVGLSPMLLEVVMKIDTRLKVSQRLCPYVQS